MEGYAVLSVVASVLEVITFGVGILSKSQEIYHSSSGSLDCHVDLEFVEGGISERCSKLRDSLTSSDNIGESPNEDQTVLVICERSIKISNELRQALESVRIKGPKTKWKSVRKALKSFYKKEEIAELNQRLSGLQTEMNSHITVKIQCRIDFVALKESEHFAKLEVGVQTLVNNVLQSHYDLSNQLNEHERSINSNIRSEGEAAQDWATRLSVVTLSAIEDSRISLRLEIQQDTRREIERVTQALMAQLKPVTELAMQYIESLDRDRGLISAPVNLGSKRLRGQKTVLDQVNFRTKTCVAKEVILQTLLDVIDLIKQHLASEEWLQRCRSFKLPSFHDMMPSAASKFSSDPEFVRILREARCKMLFHFIEAANPQLCKNTVAQDIVNLHMSRTIDLSSLSCCKSGRRFYHSIYARARVGRDWNGNLATPLESALLSLLASSAYSMPLVQTSQTPLIFAVQQMGFLPRVPDTAIVRRSSQVSYCSPLNQRYQNLSEIVDILLEGGANLHCLDNVGLSAYDHARILGLDNSTILKLKPANPYDGKTVAMPRPTHPPRLLILEPQREPLPWSSRPVFSELQRIHVRRPIVGRVQS